MTGDDYDFLTFADICEIHDDQLATYGGQAGIVDRNVVESSVAAAQWEFKFGGDIAASAAAYVYHFAVNQGFADGNKRVGVAAAVEFLARNGYRIAASNEEVFDVTMKIANKFLDKEAVANWIREHMDAIT